jgi:F-type H+-transporting ATPase subunit delta
LRGSAVAASYAEVLFELGRRSGRLEEYGRLIEATAAALQGAPEIEAVLMSPRVTKGLKARVLGAALERVGAPAEFVRYLAAVVKRGRQTLFGAIADEYAGLVDTSLNRVRAAVTVARAPDATLQAEIGAMLRRLLSKEVLASYTVDPGILGGAMVRVGDRIFDGSVRRKLVRLRRQLLAH